MATSKTQIFNLALTYLGEQPISNPDSDTDKRAIVLRQAYDMSRQALLEEHLWNFAIKRIALAPESTAPEFEWDYSFVTPSDCIRIHKFYDETGQYKEEGKTIVSDSNVMNIVYVADITDTTYFPPIFSKILALDIAITAEYGITGQNKQQASLLTQRQKLIITAKMIDAQKDNIKKKNISLINNARYIPTGDEDGI
jgi:hypothetical protein